MRQVRLGMTKNKQNMLQLGTNAPNANFTGKSIRNGRLDCEHVDEERTEELTHRIHWIVRQEA